MKVLGQKEKSMEKELCIMLLETFIKDNLKMIQKQEDVCINMLMVINLMVLCILLVIVFFNLIFI